jgi:threonylcarbamoyladenosine tRNA methylthiotransferase CDKAL1
MDKIELNVFGCGANQGEMEALGVELGLSQIPSQNPQAVALHLCTVKGDTEALTEIRKAQARAPQAQLHLSGCVTPELKLAAQQIAPNALFHSDMNSLRSALLPLSSTDTPTQGKLARAITLSSGCMDRCAYCSTVRVKGKNKSRPPEEILAEIRQAIAAGAQEIRLSGQDTACYGFDLGTNLPALCRSILALPGTFMLRLGMGNPRHLAGMEEEYAEILHHPKCYRFLHLPFQSGADITLKWMRRRHTREYGLELVQKLRGFVPDLSLSTDMIVGHPGESDEAFEQSMDFIQQIQPHFCNITRFVPREKTLAARLPAPTTQITKERSRQMSALYRSLATELHARHLDEIHTVHALELDPKTGLYLGRTSTYLKIGLKSPQPSLQSQAKITDSLTFGLSGTWI